MDKHSQRKKGMVNPVASHEKVSLDKNPPGVFPNDSTNGPPDLLKVFSSVFEAQRFESIANIVLEQRAANVHGLLVPLQSFFVDRFY